MVRGSLGPMSPRICWEGCQGGTDPARETSRGSEAGGWDIYVPALRGCPGLKVMGDGPGGTLGMIGVVVGKPLWRSLGGPWEA